MVLVSSGEEQLHGKGTELVCEFVYLCVFCICEFVCLCICNVVLVSGGGAVAPQKHQNWSPEETTEPRGTRTKTT